jgi:BMFP domain-containing protein YqiC
MAKTPAGELFSTLKSYLNQLSDGDRTPNEVASAFNGWARESAESIKAKIAEEVESQASKMGFIKRDEYEKLVTRIEKLEKQSSKAKAAKKPAPSKGGKKADKKVESKKATAKRASK